MDMDTLDLILTQFHFIFIASDESVWNTKNWKTTNNDKELFLFFNILRLSSRYGYTTKCKRASYTSINI